MSDREAGFHQTQACIDAWPIWDEPEAGYCPRRISRWSPLEKSRLASWSRSVLMPPYGFFAGSILPVSKVDGDGNPYGVRQEITAPSVSPTGLVAPVGIHRQWRTRQTPRTRESRRCPQVPQGDLPIPFPDSPLAPQVLRAAEFFRSYRREKPTFHFFLSQSARGPARVFERRHGSAQGPTWSSLGSQ